MPFNLYKFNNVFIYFFFKLFTQQEQTLRPTQEISVNLQSIGLSLADVDKRLDIAYVGIRKYVHHELSLKQADFTQAFLHANIDSDNLYMLPPQGLEEYITPGHVL